MEDNFFKKCNFNCGDTDLERYFRQCYDNWLQYSDKHRKVLIAEEFLKKHFNVMIDDIESITDAMHEYAEHCILKERINTAKAKGEFEGFLKGVIHWGIESKYKRIIDDKIKELENGK